MDNNEQNLLRFDISVIPLVKTLYTIFLLFILISMINLQVLARGVECDIALLSVESEEFWKGAEPLQLGHLPRLQVVFFLFYFLKEE